MANYKDPERKATETMTFRFTLSEKLLLNQLAKAESKSKTDLLRDLIAQRARQLGFSEPPPEPRPVRPGRPKKSVQDAVREDRTDEIGSPYHDFTAEAREPELTFGFLIVRFRDHFSDRAEGTRKELEETIRFFFDDDGEGEKLLDRRTALNEIDSQKLIDLRERIIRSNIRMAKMNLYLTYLRMMLHFAVKQLSLSLGFNPSDFLKPFTVSEIPQSWPGRRF